MGPRIASRIFRPLLAVSCMLCLAPVLGAQVFVVGEKSATEDVVTEFHPTHIEIPTQPLDEKGRQELLRDLEAEQGFAHRELPLGAGLTLIANGKMTPGEEQFKQMLYKKGQSVGPGDRVAITSLKFEADRIVIDLNGGPYAKHRFLSHISINDIQLAPQGPIATGCRITLVFEGGLPQVTAAEVKALLDPLVDFHAKTSDEAYADTLPTKAREAVEAHEILVGMDKRMVLASVGAPHDKHREHVDGDDPNSPQFEEWIYGEPPQATQFVRFRNGRVVRLEIAALGKPIEIHDHNEMGVEAGPVLQTRTIANGDVRPGMGGDTTTNKAPSLRLPGEATESVPGGMGKVNLPPDTPKQPFDSASNR
ncbi:MAG TPA: hypothetical protein VGN16_11955 [Acidobacteriaceae bacterium]